MLIDFNIHHLTKEYCLTGSATMRFYPCVPTRVTASLRRWSEGPRLASSDLVTVSVEPGGSASQSTHFQSPSGACCITRPPAAVNTLM